MIISISGKRQVGKSSMAKYIKDMLTDRKVKEISFAYHLKEFIHQGFNIPKKHLYGSNDDKEFPLCTWGEIFNEECLEKHNKRPNDLLNARTILQLVGSDFMRYGKKYLVEEYELLCQNKLVEWFGSPAARDSVWIDLTLRDVHELQMKNEIDVAIVSDVRFVNEYEILKKNDATMIRLYRYTGLPESNHVSEVGMDKIEDDGFDFVLYEEDNRNLKQLRTFTTNVLMNLGLLGIGDVI